jgi:hypothetical protein
MVKAMSPKYASVLPPQSEIKEVNDLTSLCPGINDASQIHQNESNLDGRQPNGSFIL